MVFLCKNGFPVELIKGKWFKNFLRLLVHTRSIKRGVWVSGKVVTASRLIEAHTILNAKCQRMTEKVVERAHLISEIDKALGYTTVTEHDVLGAANLAMAELKDLRLSSKAFGEKITAASDFPADGGATFEELVDQFIATYKERSADRERLMHELEEARLAASESMKSLKAKTIEYKALEASIKSCDNLVRTQCAKGTVDYDHYMHGMANGVLLIWSTINDEPYMPIDAPVQWGDETLNSGYSGVLPLISEDKSGNVVDRVVCDSISGGADYLHGMPRGLTLSRTQENGTTCVMSYVQFDSKEAAKKPATLRKKRK